ncbi:MAG: prolipoprotein diacylglyceryl transferase [Anaerolineae bacterium]|nr:prolipoprotein diacylglyceryl transferase [Anaerolineae bacterium]
MWEQLLQCSASGRVAFCIPWPAFLGGPTLAIYWYGILAATGIFLGAMYAAKHVEWEGQDPDVIWDAFFWILIAALIGARLWYVLQAIIGGTGEYSLARPLDIINTRQGGMNIFGGAIFGAIAIIIYARVRKLDIWLLTDAALMGLLIGQGIGRIGNFINAELYGPPTGSSWFGMLVPQGQRIGIYADMTTYPPDTRFHPTMFYEAFWLLLVFGVLFYIFRRYQEQIVHGRLTGAYLMAAGVGRFVIEFFRLDQPKIPGSIFSYSQLMSVLFFAVGLIVFLDRMGHFRIPLIARPQNERQRQQAYQKILDDRRKRERAEQRAKERERRRKQREQIALEKAEAAVQVSQAEAEEAEDAEQSMAENS